MAPLPTALCRSPAGGGELFVLSAPRSPVTTCGRLRVSARPAWRSDDIDPVRFESPLAVCAAHRGRLPREFVPAAAHRRCELPRPFANPVDIIRPPLSMKSCQVEVVKSETLLKNLATAGIRTYGDLRVVRTWMIL